MNEFKTVLLAVLPVFALMLGGIFMRKWNWLSEEADKSLLRITVNVLAPSLIFTSILRNEALKQIGNVTLAPLIGFCSVALGMGIAFFCKKLSGLRETKSLGTFILCVGLYNYGYIAVPLANLIFPRETIGVLFVHNLGVEVAMWTLGLTVLSASGGSFKWSKIFSPPVVTVLVALPINFLHGDQWIPSFVLTAIKMLGDCAIPMGLILIGATMADHLHEFHASGSWRAMFGFCFLRNGLLPLLFLTIAKYLPCSIELKRVIVLQSAMPTAVFTIVMARHFGGDATTALRAVLATSVLGIVTIPLWVRFGMKFVGL